jgi:hypothetical protein
MGRAAGQLTGIQKGIVAVAREIAGPIAIDSATLTDANILPSLAINCSRYDTLFVGVEIDVPGTALMTIEALFRDPFAVDGSRWKRLMLGSTPGVTALATAASEDTGALDGSKMAEIRVYGAKLVYLRVKTVANTVGTTASRILVMPGTVRRREA